MRHIYVIILLSVLFMPAGIQAQTPLSHAATPALNEVLAIADGFFDKFEKLDVQTAMKHLFEIFPLKPDAQNAFVRDVANLKTKLGIPTGHEFIGYRPIGATQRYFVMYFMTFHPRMPVAWELTFYRPDLNGPWQLNYIRFDADDIHEFLEFTRLQFEALRRQNSDAAATPGSIRPEHLSEPTAPDSGGTMK